MRGLSGLGAAEQDGWVVTSRWHMGRGEGACVLSGGSRGCYLGQEGKTVTGEREVTSEPVGHGHCQDWLSLIEQRCFGTRLPATPAPASAFPGES